MPLRDAEDMDAHVDRRGFLGLFTRTILWISGAAGLAGLVRFLSYDREPQSTGPFSLDFHAAYPLGSLTPIPEAQAFLVHDQAGFFARSLICPHLGCVVEKSEGGYQCPCHGSRFGESGDLIHGPAKKPLKSVWIGLDEDGRLILDVHLEVPWEWRLVV
jgi:cytochrome b6-f complex iron-sulfur subunit